MKIDYTLERQNSISIDRLRDLLGHDAVLLPCAGKRPPVTGWQKLTAETMLNHDYLAKLASASNIGVLLGERSGGLCVVDFDADGEDENFLALNPSLADTLRTRGRRGSSFWLRIVGEFPTNTKLKSNGKDLGEWRATGNQSIVAGLHPDTGLPYRMLNEARPIEIPFKNIVWPDGVDFSKTPRKTKDLSRCDACELPKNVTHAAHVSDVADVSDVANDTQAVRGVTGKRDLSGATEDEIVALCVPNKMRENNDRLFGLARGVKTLERERGRGREYSERDLKRVFGKWYRKSRRFLRAGQSRAQYYEEFLRACDTAQVALDEGGLLTAWQRAKKSTPPACASVFKSSAARLLVGLCWQLQRLAGDSDFFLSCYDAGKLLGMSPKHAASLLRTLVSKGILGLIEKGGMGHATRYRFVPKPDSKGIAI